MIRLSEVTKSYPTESGDETVFRKVSLEIERGDRVSVLGASGCGKSTLLNLLSGIEKHDEGFLQVQATRVGYMFQTDRLLPWRTAKQNALLGLELSGNGSNADAEREVKNYFRRLGLKGVESKYPSHLSGGMRQRVALARTFLYDPELLLLDEPFSALDYRTKLDLEQEVIEYSLRSDRTVIFVTHDIDEAIAIGDRLLVLRGEPSKGVPTKVVKDIRVEFKSDAAGRNPVRAREESLFARYFSEIWGVLGNG